MGEFEVKWPDNDKEPVDINAEPQSDQPAIQPESYDQPAFEGPEENPKE